MELDEHSQDKSILALRYQVYDACEDAVAALLAAPRMMSERELVAEVDKLVAIACERLKDRSEYAYALSSETFLRDVVLTLFDDCFLSFDGDNGV